MGTKKSRKYLRAVASSGVVLGSTTEQLTGLDRVLSEAQAADLLGYSKDTLRRAFRAGEGPARVRLSERRIGYRLSANYSWLAAHTELSDKR
jgi:predicted DNA-binding transcriptional regulator AlpA